MARARARLSPSTRRRARSSSTGIGGPHHGSRVPGLVYDCSALETAAPPQIDAVPAAVRGEPPPRHGGPLTLLRFMAARGMVTPRYVRLLIRLAWLRLRF